MEQDNGVIIERLNNLIKDNKEEHQSILDQVTATNGAVAGIQKWRYIITGGFIVSNIIIVPIIITLILKYM